jgi:hypothetical protein
MYTWIIAGTAGLMTVVAILRLPFGKGGGHELCSYLSLTLPLFGFVALQERQRLKSSVEALEDGQRALPQPVDEERAAAQLKKIEADSATAPETSPSPASRPSLSPLQFFWSILAAPRRAFHELSQRACPELTGTTLVILLLQPIVNGNPQLSFTQNFIFLSMFFLLYALGRSCLLMLACRWLSCRVSIRTAFQGVLVNEVIFAFLLAALLIIPSLQGMSGQIPYIRLGLGEWVRSIGPTSPFLFNYLAQLHVFSVWGFGLWWVGIASVTGGNLQKVFFVALLSFVAMYTYVCPLRHLVQALVVW